MNDYLNFYHLYTFTFKVYLVVQVFSYFNKLVLKKSVNIYVDINYNLRGLGEVIYSQTLYA